MIIFNKQWSNGQEYHLDSLGQAFCTLFLKYIYLFSFVHLPTVGLSCCMRDLLVVAMACERLVTACGI